MSKPLLWKDVRIDTFRTGMRYTKVSVTHLSTGLIASCDLYPGELQNRAVAIETLRKLVKNENKT